MTQKMEAAGIAPASRNSQVDTQHSTYGNAPPPCLHTVCTDFGQRELVAIWHRLTPDVSDKILDLARKASEQ
jgi:hypothetical protein